MSAKHTYGPWRVGELHANQIDINHEQNQPGAISLTLAKVTARSTWIAEAESNARLIAAAPDLLAALQAIASAAEEISGGIFPDDYQEELEAARAAINKALGAKP